MLVWLNAGVRGPTVVGEAGAQTFGMLRGPPAIATSPRTMLRALLQACGFSGSRRGDRDGWLLRYVGVGLEPA